MPSKTLRGIQAAKNNDEATPVFDLSNHSFNDYMEHQAIEAEMLGALASGNTADGQKQAVVLSQKRFKFWTKILREVPKGYLVADAPDSLDWSDIDSYKWLRYDGVRRLIVAYNEAITAQKN